METDPRRVRSFDTETHLIQAGLLAPPLVCASYGHLAGDEIAARVLDRGEAVAVFRSLLAQGVTIVGANLAYDVGVLLEHDPTLADAVFAAGEAGHFYDVQIAQALDGIARGMLLRDPTTGGPLMVAGKDGKQRQASRYSLETCVRLVLGRLDAKANDFWRLRYAILEELPLEAWPEEARVYPADDARNTLEVALVQLGLSPQQNGRPGLRNLGDVASQCRAAVALHLGAAWGLRTDRDAVAAVRARAEVERAEAHSRFANRGWIKDDGKDDGVAVKREVARLYGATGVCRVCGGSGKIKSATTGKPVGCTPRNAGSVVTADDMVANDAAIEAGDPVAEARALSIFVCDGTGLDLATAPSLPRTAGGGVSTDRDTLMESGDDDLAAYGAGGADKILDTYVPWLESGVDRPITLAPNVLVATGRCSYSGVIQLLPRDGGVRECFRSRPGYLFCSTDYPAEELCTLAQVAKWVVGWSNMLDAINASGDPSSLHSEFAARMVGVSPSEMSARVKAKEKEAVGFRQAAKAANFGFPGGMGAAKLVLAKRKPAEGSTASATRKYPGIRFCLLIPDPQGGVAAECGVEKVTEWKGRPTPPICKRCVTLVEYVLRPSWFNQWPEMKEYFAWVSDVVESIGEVPCFDPTSPDGVARVRGGVDFCNGANNGFQALASDVAKRALWLVQRECFTGKKPDGSASPLFGSRAITLIHDEVFSEVPEEGASDAAIRQAMLMTEALRAYTPDLVPIAVEPALSRVWSKGMSPVWNTDGGQKRLVEWVPK